MEDFIDIVRRHQQSAFQITFGLVRDEPAAETLTREVFTRARRRLAAGMDAGAATLWIYRACLRFACRLHWKNIPAATRHRLVAGCHDNHHDDFDLAEFVHVLAFHPGKIDPRDCELISLRHVLKLSLQQMGQLLRMHPYEISNRLAWSRERVKEIGGTIVHDLHPQYA